MTAASLRASTVAVACCLLSIPVVAATLPSGFSETRVATGLLSPTAMAIAPDGRVFVAEKDGALRVVKNDALLPEPFLTVSVSTTDTKGLLGVAFDPEFHSNQFIYVYYTTVDAPIHPRVSRFTASSTNPDVAQAGSELQILNLPRLPSSAHVGGAIHFGTDGKLYVAVGDNSVPANSQSLNTTLGKLLRINRDGSIPADNPFYSQTTGDNRAIWALGLRNPFTFGVDPAFGRIHINDVGQNTWEEVNLGVRGANYGWPQTEGPEPAGVSGVRYPIYSYQHDGTTCAVIGASFYRPYALRFPREYNGRYFFGDFCAGFIRTLSPPNYTTAGPFASGIGSLVDIQTHPDGSLYYLARAGGELFRVQSTTSMLLLNDDFESFRGWVEVFPGDISPATTGRWARGDPEPTITAGKPLQLGSCQGSTNCLITGLAAGSFNGANDVDNGQTSIHSPPIVLPAGRAITLSFGFYFAHNANATSADFFRVRVIGENGVGQTVWARGATASNVGAVWSTRTANLDAWAGQTIQIRLDAVDRDTASLIEAGVDNVVITAH